MEGTIFPLFSNEKRKGESGGFPAASRWGLRGTPEWLVLCLDDSISPAQGQLVLTKIRKKKECS